MHRGIHEHIYMYEYINAPFLRTLCPSSHALRSLHICICMYVFMQACMYACSTLLRFLHYEVCIPSCMYVRMCVCMYACVYVCTTHVCMYVRMCVCMYAWVYVCNVCLLSVLCLYVCMYVCNVRVLDLLEILPYKISTSMYVCMYVSLIDVWQSPSRKSANHHVGTYVCLHNIYILVCMHVCMHVCAHVSACMHFSSCFVKLECLYVCVYIRNTQTWKLAQYIRS